MKLIFSCLLFCCTAQVFSQKQEYICPIEISPKFPGGLDSLKVFIRRNLNYPPGRIDCEGTVYIQFTVNVDSTLSDITVLKGICDSYDKYALEVFKKNAKMDTGQTSRQMH